LTAFRALFWDVGGVLLTNAWDHNERTAALSHFQLDADDFQRRHETVVEPFERGELTLDEYLAQTVFYHLRPFTRDEFRDYMFSLSKPLPGSLDFAQALGRSGKYLMATINNESRELNLHRIEKFGMRDIFRLFFSSCFVRMRKPDPEIYQLALDVTQISPAESVFVDDRPENLKAAAGVGMQTVQMRGLEQLQADLAKLGVQPWQGL
jgi:putative hydrolase of the HAD superfamily